MTSDTPETEELRAYTRQLFGRKAEEAEPETEPAPDPKTEDSDARAFVARLFRNANDD